jgi:hypothetical protein
MSSKRWRTLPALRYDSARSEDLDINGEDHAGGDVRGYACMSRSWVLPAKAAPVKPRDRWDWMDRIDFEEPDWKVE